MATNEGQLTPLRGRYANLRMSLYADDAVLFINPVKTDVEMTMKILQLFGEAMGRKINMEKSSVVPIRCTGLNLDEILTTFNGQRVEFPVTYLGLPLTLGHLKIFHLQYIQDRALAKLSGWEGKLLNLGGHRELVRSVLSSLPTYLLTTLRPPKKFYKDMDKIRRCFLWAGTQQLQGGKCKISWARVCRPLNQGGLGVMDMVRQGQALRLRWLWFNWKKQNSHGMVWNFL